jgi:hypothetical protein
MASEEFGKLACCHNVWFHGQLCVLVVFSNISYFLSDCEAAKGEDWDRERMTTLGM